MLKRVKFIYNHSSGEKSITEQLDQIINLYQEKGFIMSLYRLNFAKEQEQQIIEDLKGADFHHVLIAGGDGTVNYIVNILKSNNINIPIAILPTGTANDFASVLGMPKQVIPACKKLLSGEFSNIDLGKVNDKYFVNVFSCGSLTEVSQKTPTALKNAFGQLAYYMGGLGELTKIKKMEIEIQTDTKSFSGSALLFFVFNGQTAGRLKLAYLSKLDDGMLDVLIVKGNNPLETVGAVLNYFSNLRRKKYSRGIVHIQCKKLSVKSLKPETTDIDGQVGPDFPLNMECVQGGLKILLPQQKRKR